MPCPSEQLGLLAAAAHIRRMLSWGDVKEAVLFKHPLLLSAASLTACGCSAALPSPTSATD